MPPFSIRWTKARVGALWMSQFVDGYPLAPSYRVQDAITSDKEEYRRALVEAENLLRSGYPNPEHYEDLKRVSRDLDQWHNVDNQDVFQIKPRRKSWRDLLAWLVRKRF